MSSVELKPLTLDYITDIKAICDEQFEKCFHITETKLTTNLFEAEDFCREGSFVLCDTSSGEVKGFIGIKVRHVDEVYTDTAWISIFAVKKADEKKGYGDKLLKSVMDYLKKEKIKTIYIGMDYKNFFSGIPSPTDEVCSFFEKRGFVTDPEEHFDVEANVQNNAKMDAFDVTPFDGKYYVSTFNGEKEDMLEFLEAEFPGRWVYEAKYAFETKKPYERIMLLKEVNPSHDKVVGFCMLSEYAPNYGGLGPIGIAKSVRGKHLGDFLLRQSLMQLRNLKMQDVNIDWTRLLDFYGQFGFEIERRYRACIYKF